MRTTITLDDNLFEKAAAIAGDSNASSLLTKALEMMISAESRKRLLRLSGATPDFAISGRDTRTSELGKVAEDGAPYTEYHISHARPRRYQYLVQIFPRRPASAQFTD